MATLSLLSGKLFLLLPSLVARSASSISTPSFFVFVFNINNTHEFYGGEWKLDVFVNVYSSEFSSSVFVFLKF